MPSDLELLEIPEKYLACQVCFFAVLVKYSVLLWQGQTHPLICLYWSFFSDLSKRLLHCCEQFICLYFFQVVLHVYCVLSRQCSIRTNLGFGHQEILYEAGNGGRRPAMRPAHVRTLLLE